MIENEQQYRVTKAWVQKFTQTLAHLEAHPHEGGHLHPLLQKAEQDGLMSQIEALQGEVQAYETLRDAPPA